MKISTKKTAALALLVAVAMILSYVESLVPLSLAIPGVKLGLSNIATLFALYALGSSGAVCVSIIRVILSSLLFGNAVGFIYSFSGAVLSLIFMILLSRVNIFSSIGVSVIGGVAHNAGQIIAACIIMENSAIATYLAPLVISGTAAGVVIGIVAGILLERVKKHI